MSPSHRPPTSAGEMLLEEFLKPRRITPRQAARRMGISVSRLNNLIQNRDGMSIEIARQLATLLDTTPEFWMNLSVR